MTRRRVVLIGGPTAVGKSALALKLALRLGGEIVNADSRQIYTNMDIGTAKPSAGERALAPHHLLDLVRPDETYSLALYLRDARNVIASIHGRGALPIVVGGTGLYLRALAQGYDVPAVPPNPQLRAQLEELARDRGVEVLASRLRERDPVTANRIDTQNPRRVIRALELLDARGVVERGDHAVEAPYDALVFVLELERAALFARASTRLSRMVDDGFIAEVERLLALGYTLDLPAMSALGYREFGRFVLGESNVGSAMTATESSTRAFIKRQLTWFRGDRHAKRVSVDSADLENEVLRRIAEWRGSAGT